YLKGYEDGIYAKIARDRLRELIAATVPKPKKLGPAFVPDQSLLLEPYCVKCSTKANIGNEVAIGPAHGVGYCPRSRDIYINPRLIENRWLNIVPNGTVIPNWTLVGTADGFDAYVESPAYWQQFVLALQQAQETGSGVTPGGKTASNAPVKK